MNPFIDATVALPLALERPALTSLKPARLPPEAAKRASARWAFPFMPQGRDRVARRTSVAAMLAGMGVGLSAHALDLNAATAEQLKSLRGVGPRTAQIIVQERNRAGRFESLEDLSDRVRGIGPKRLQALQAAGLRVSGEGRGINARASQDASLGAPGAEAAGSRARAPAAGGVATPTIDPAPAL